MRILLNYPRGTLVYVLLTLFFLVQAIQGSWVFLGVFISMLIFGLIAYLGFVVPAQKSDSEFKQNRGEE